MLIRSTFLFLAFIFCVCRTTAQTQRCHTMEYEQFLFAQDSLLYVHKEFFESRIKDYMQSARGLQPFSEAGVIKIPVVIHIIGNDPISKVTTSAINDQINILNQDYRRVQGSNGYGAGVDTKIEFCLAQFDPDGQPTQGINKITGNFAEWDHRAPSTNSNSDASLKLLIHWPPEKYLNLYVAELCCSRLGYAAFPWDFAALPFLDGVAIDPDYFGNKVNGPYNRGRTATHEIGHWLGLYHTFQIQSGDASCQNNDCDIQGDKVCDTPPVWNTNNVYPNPPGPNFNCPNPPPNSCGTDNNDPGYPFPDIPDLIENYMDYTDDICMNMFTKDQATRMHGTLNTTRFYPSFSSCISHCNNGIKDADETGVDCGGSDCNPCAEHCTNGIRDADEAGVDCGGFTCQPCNNSSEIITDPCKVFSIGTVALNGFKSDIPCINYNDNIVLSPAPPLCNNPAWFWPITHKTQRCNTAPNSSLCSKHTVDFWNCNCKYFQYFIEIAQVDNNFNQIGIAYSKWFVFQPSDINQNGSYYKTTNITVSQNDLSTLGITLVPSKLYRIKLARTRGVWQEKVRFFRVKLQDIYLNNVSVTTNQLGVNVTLQNIAPPITNVTVAATNSIRMLPNTKMGLNSIAILQDPPSCAVFKMENNNNDIPASVPYNNLNQEPIKAKKANVLNAYILPNPSDGKFILQFKESSEGEIFIYNNLGGIVHQSKIIGNQLSVDLSNHPKGIYFVKVQDANRIYTEKVVVQ